MANATIELFLVSTEVWRVNHVMYCVFKHIYAMSTI